MGFNSAVRTHVAMESDVTEAFLRQMTIEITPRQAEKLPLIAENVSPGTRVFVALVDPLHLEDQITAVRQIRILGLEPVPHVPARFVRNEDDLRDRIGRLAASGSVKQYLVLGGGAPEPVGKYDQAMHLLETGVFQANGAEFIGVAGHPEGNPEIERAHGKAVLLEALKRKQSYIKESGMQGFIATQFLFEATPVAKWAQLLRAEGIGFPAYVGIPGPASIKTLARYAAVCGVGNSARFIRKQALNVTKLLRVSTPDKFIDDLATLTATQPELKIAGPHMYPFGGFDKLFDWLAAKMARAA